MFLRKISLKCESLLLNTRFQLIKPTVSYTQSLTYNFQTLSKEAMRVSSLTYKQDYGFKFIGIPKRKGMFIAKHKTKKNSMKKRGRINIKYLHRVSNHNGLLKRIKIVGPRWDRRFKFRSAGRRHLMRNKTKSNIRRLRRNRYVEKCDMERMKKMIPTYKMRKTKDNN